MASVEPEASDDDAPKMPQTYEEAMLLVRRLMKRIRRMEDEIEGYEGQLYELQEELDEKLDADVLEAVRNNINNGDLEYAIELIGREIGY